MIQVEKIDTFGGHKEPVYTLCQSVEKSNKSLPSTGIFYSAAGDGMVVRWNLAKPDLGDLIARVPNSVYALAFDELRNELWIGQNYEGIHVVDPLSKAELRTLKLNSAAIFDIQIADRIALVASGDGVISIIDIENFVFRKHIKASEKSVRCLAVHSERNEFAAGYSDNTIGIFDLQNFDLKTLIPAHENSVFTLKYSPDGRHLLSGGRDAHLKIWDVQQNYSLKKDIVAHLFAINCIEFSPNNLLFATCSMDKSIKIWEAESFKLLKVIDRARHAGHGTSINKLLWTDFDNQLISCSDDRTISVWKLLFE